MTVSQEIIEQIATKSRAVMLSNPHVYPETKIEGIDRQMAEKLILLAVEMAEYLIEQVERKHQDRPEFPIDAVNANR